MNGERFSQWLPNRNPSQQPAASAFMMVPVGMQAGMGGGFPFEQLYRQAYEQAQAVTRPSILERLSADLVN